MKIKKHAVVTMDYTLTNDNGQTLDSSAGRDPLVYLHGAGNLIPGLEAELEGMEKGNNVKATIEPKDAYGVRRDDLLRVVPKSGFQGDEELQVGMQVQLQTEQGQAIASVSKIEGDNVTLDMNHPLADVRLHFNVDIKEVREATADEINHGHVHGPGGHQH